MELVHCGIWVPGLLILDDMWDWFGKGELFVDLRESFTVKRRGYHADCLEPYNHKIGGLKHFKETRVKKKRLGKSFELWNYHILNSIQVEWYFLETIMIKIRNKTLTLVYT